MALTARGHRVSLLGLTGCVVTGSLVASGQAMAAVVLVGGALLAGLLVLQRRRATDGLWAAVAFTAPLQGVRIIPEVALSDLLIVVALIAMLPHVRRGWRRTVPGGVVAAFGLIVVAGIVGTFFAPSTAASMGTLVKIVMAAAGSVFAMVLWSPRPQAARRFAWFWYAGAATSAAWALVTPRDLFAGRATGLTTHPNHFGLECVLAVALGLGLATSSSGRGRAAALAGVALLTVGVGLSGSRAALVALIITVGAVAILTQRVRLLVAVTAVVILGSMAVVAGIIHVPESNALSRLVGGGGAAVSDAERAQVRSAALETVDRHPLTGEGFGQALAAHNIYLQTLVVGGPVALIGFLWVGAMIVRTGTLGSLLLGRRTEGALLAGLTAGYVGYLGSGVFDNILWDRYLWTYIGLLLVLAASARRSASTQPTSGEVVRSSSLQGVAQQAGG